MITLIGSGGAPPPYSLAEDELERLSRLSCRQRRLRWPTLQKGGKTMVDVNRPAVKLAAVLAFLGCQGKNGQEPFKTPNLPLRSQNTTWTAKRTEEQRN